MMRKLLVVLVGVVAMGTVCHAEAMKPLLTKENAFPDVFQPEVGVLAQYREIPEDDGPEMGFDQYDIGPYVRFGLLKNLAVYGMLPYVMNEPEFGDKEQGVGDAVVGVEFLAYEDIFKYPFVIPHAEVSLSTGDEDKGLGAGDNEYVFGVSIGTVVDDMFHYIVDLSYNVQGDDENIGLLSGTFMWDLNEQFSVLLEARASNADGSDATEDDDDPVFFQGGMYYTATEAFGFGLYVGGGHNMQEDVVLSGKASYSF